MDLCVKNLFPANSSCYRPISGTRSCNSFSEITLFTKQHYRPFLLTASANNNNHGNSSSSSSGNGEPSIPGNNDGDKSNNNSQKRHQINLDWRDFRAKLYRDELKEIEDTDTQKEGGTIDNSKPLGTKWAHPIPGPETGCVLVATEKLDGVRTFERTVVLLLRSGTRQSQEGPFGIVINRPLHKKIKNIRPTNQDLTTSFSDCSLHFGGPLEASMFLLKSGEKLKVPGFEEVVPGLYFGARNSLDDASRLVKKGIIKPRDFSFFIGYAGWQIDQLRDEIESEYWHVAACSSSLLYEAMTDSSEGMWEEILQLMGGDYSELSQKPKQEDP
ncbi:unnamed protein product [Lathyrus oleraceus]|uniref:Uncharacterized protein n=1 Tax=Pisum sativum TaxID=3888 RepID=A0A9D5BDS3_PEA|nr:uncharacterized protein LOC127076035 [Pisum sativum]XP_050881457.1 uncharacterized protein LOC127076035 [Pisum sativum]KAI5440331.1 hypothetical protein KIW84_010004 [Pisum sativum]